MQAFIAHSFGGLAVCMALAELEHGPESKLVLIAPATETKTALDLFFNFLKVDNQSVRKEFEDIILKISGHPPEWFSIRRALDQIHAKVLWIHDEDDTTTPLSDMLVVQKEQHDNIQYVITRGLGHRRIYRDDEVNRKVMAFL
jgi:pimeloyl-ACP methyl ester carboxylesterase